MEAALFFPHPRLAAMLYCCRTRATSGVATFSLLAITAKRDYKSSSQHKHALSLVTSDLPAYRAHPLQSRRRADLR